MSDKKRAPRAFSLDEPRPTGAQKKVAPSATSAKKSAATPRKRQPKVVAAPPQIELLPQEAAQRLSASEQQIVEQLTPPVPPVVEKPGLRWSRIFWGSLAALVSLAMGLWFDQLIRDLFARQDWLGWLAVVLVAVFAVSVLAMVLRELWSLRRMAHVDHLRALSAQIAVDNDPRAARKVLKELASLYGNRGDTQKGLAALAAHENEIIDGRDLLALAERDLLKGLDGTARRLVMGSAKRVSVVTAVSPRAIVDVGFVLFENMRLIRQLAQLYGGRPGTLGFWRLARNVVGHLAVTGSIAIGDGLLQQVVGQGLASKLSSRLGEGVVNGLLTARIGIAAIDVCRPLAFSNQHRPTVSDFMSELLRSSGGGHEDARTK